MSASTPLAEVAGVRFRPSRFEDIERAISGGLSGDRSGVTIGYANPHVVTTAEEHPEIGKHLEACDHVCVDGIGVWLALGLWRHGVERLPAYRAADDLVSSGVLHGRTAVIGIEADLIEQAASGLAARSSTIDVVGFIDGFSSDGEISTMLEQEKPELILIGAGSPKSEQIAELARRTCPQATIFHVGAGTLKNWAGEREHAPQILSALGIDWIYRFLKEPHTRPRYSEGIPQFVRRTLTESRSVTYTDAAKQLVGDATPPQQTERKGAQR